MGTTTTVALVDIAVKGNVQVGVKASSAPTGIAIGPNRVASGQAFVDFHGLIGSVDYESRIVRNAGANGSFQLINTGTGDFTLRQVGLGAIKLQTNSLDRFGITDQGAVRVISSAFAEIYFGSSMTGSGAAAISVDIANSALRVITGTTEKAQFNSAGSLVMGVNANQEKIKLFGSGTTGDAYAGFYTNSGSTSVGFIGTAKGLNSSSAATELGIRAETFLQFFGPSAEWGRFTSVGTFNVGTTTSGAQLYVRSTSATRDTARFEGLTGAAATQRVAVFHHPATSGDNTLIEFLTEANGTARGNIRFRRTLGIMQYNTASDARMKENIADAPSQGALIDSFKVRSFRMKGLPDSYQIGFLAQELYLVAPIAVSKGSDLPALTGNPGEIWGVDASKLVPILTKEIQDLRVRVASLETQMANALSRIITLERKGILWPFFG